jgi:chemosensory pili system protein ChpA (sensor histidine kinase/response regulator)
MQRQVDREVLLGFVEEAKSYLTTIRQGIQAWRDRPEERDALAEAHRHVHTIKGASSMVGFNPLSHMAYQLEETLEEIMAGAIPAHEATFSFLHHGVDLIEKCLENVGNDQGLEDALVQDMSRSYRRLRGLPEDAPIPEVKKTAPPPVADIDASPREEVSAELLEVFALEAEDHLRNISSLLPLLEQQPNNQDLVQDVRRSAHTLKGAAAMVGFREVTQLAHRMEDLLDQLFEGTRPVTPAIVQLLFSSTDTLEDLAAGRRHELDLEALYARYTKLFEGEAVTSMAAGEKLTTPLELPELQPAATSEAEEFVASGPSAPAVAGSRNRQFLRVPFDRLDDLVRLVSELVITRTTFEQRMGDFLKLVGELQPSTNRLHRASYKLETQYEAALLGGNRAPARGNGQAKGHASGNGHGAGFVPINRLAGAIHGFDDLELDRYTEFHLLSRELAETTADIQTVTGELGHLIGDFDGYLNRQGRLTSEIEDKLRRLRMVPLATLANRLHRTVRTVANQQGKQADLVLEGESTELDKSVLEEMADPLLHLLRNAVDHGIEPPELRQVKGKRPRGAIRLRAYHEGSQVVIQVADDGAGADPGAIRDTAFARGYLSADEAARISDPELLNLIFLPGFSTAQAISEISGRGVGLDIVKAQVSKLKGTLTLQSSPNQGATFTIRLPMTMAITRALMVRANQETFAIPLDSVIQILRVERPELERIGQEPVVRVGGEVYPVLFLGKFLGLKQPADDSAAQIPILLLHTGSKRIGLVVDRLLGGREIVIKSLGSHLRRVPGITGATLMGDGSVVLIINPTDLARDAVPARTPVVRTPTVPVGGARPGESLSVLIVDDSPSVRRVVANLIKNAGWQSMTAKDGLEALELLHRSSSPDLVLLDIEMPRMDGFELLSTLRSQEEYQRLPVIMVTSRAGEKHRKKAMDLGATGYVIKPYQDEALLKLIHQLVQQSRQVAGV